MAEWTTVTVPAGWPHDKASIELTDAAQAADVRRELGRITLTWGGVQPQPITDRLWRQVARAVWLNPGWSPTAELLARKAWMESRGHSPSAILDSLGIR